MTDKKQPRTEEKTEDEDLELDESMSFDQVVEVEKKKEEREGVVGKFLYTVMVIFGIAFIIATFFGNVLFFSMRVMGYSMYPNYNASATGVDGGNNNDVVYLGNYGNFHRGNVVVFDSGTKDKDDKTIFYIKRIIAIPGDTVSFKETNQTIDGSHLYVLILNGVEQDEAYVKEDMKTKDVLSPFYRKYITMGETLTIAENEYFVMGDNRNDSTDSRIFGTISKEKIIGKVYLHIEHGDTVIRAIWKAIF